MMFLERGTRAAQAHKKDKRKQPKLPCESQAHGFIYEFNLCFLKAALGALPRHRGELGPRGGRLGNTFKLKADAFLSLCRSEKTKRREGK